MSEKAKEFGIVVFFKENEEGVYDCIGQTIPLKFLTALDVYANTPNPASQLVEGDTIDEVTSEATAMVNKMKDHEYVEKYVYPYL